MAINGIPAVPVFADGDTWPEWAQKLGDWATAEWKLAAAKNQWNLEHPGC